MKPKAQSHWWWLLVELPLSCCSLAGHLGSAVDGGYMFPAAVNVHGSMWALFILGSYFHAALVVCAANVSEHFCSS
jgi:hypothetical protein